MSFLGISLKGTMGARNALMELSSFVWQIVSFTDKSTKVSSSLGILGNIVGPDFSMACFLPISLRGDRSGGSERTFYSSSRTFLLVTEWFSIPVREPYFSSPSAPIWVKDVLVSSTFAILPLAPRVYSRLRLPFYAVTALLDTGSSVLSTASLRPGEFFFIVRFSVCGSGVFLGLSRYFGSVSSTSGDTEIKFLSL